MKKQNAFLWPGAFFTENVSGVETGVEYEYRAAEREKLQTLKAVTEEQIEPVSAAPQLTEISLYQVGNRRARRSIWNPTGTEAVRKSISGLEPELDSEGGGMLLRPRNIHLILLRVQGCL